MNRKLSPTHRNIALVATVVLIASVLTFSGGISAGAVAMENIGAFLGLINPPATFTVEESPAFVIPNAGSVSLTTAAPYSENFSTLANTGTSDVVPNGWHFSEADTGANTTYTAGSGTSTGGETYSFGTGTTTERAFGGLRSGSLIPTIGASFTNSTGTTITALQIAYTGEQWRRGNTGGAADRLDFQYSTNATSLTTGTWIDVNALDFSSPFTTSSGARDGNAVGNRTAISSTISSLAIANGSTFWIRWNDIDITNSDDGLAVDDFSLTPTLAQTLQFSAATYSKAENEAPGSATITVTRTGGSDGVVGASYSFAAGGTAIGGALCTGVEDYVAGGGTVSFGNGVTTPQTFTVPICPDAIYEADETVNLQLSSPTGGATLGTQSTAVLTITNDDPTTSTILITEVESVPPPGGVEWIELYNAGPSFVSLGGWTITDNADTDVIPAGTNIAPGGIIVIASNANTFLALRPGYTGAVYQIDDGSIGNSLTNAGDVVVLRNSAAQDIDCMNYGTNTSCFSPSVPVIASTDTLTYQRISSFDSNTNADWSSSNTESPGSFLGITPNTPVMTTSPASLAFGNVATGLNSAGQDVTISNMMGTGQLTYSLTVTGPDGGSFVIDDPSSGSVVATQARQVTIKCNPMTVGDKFATLTITGNDLLNSSDEVALTCTGIPFTKSVLITEVESGPYPPHTTQWIEIQNVSGGSMSLDGWGVTDDNPGLSVPFNLIPAGTNIANGEFIVLTTNPTDFLSDRPGFAAQVVDLEGTTIGTGLANAGDGVRLFDGQLSEVDCMSYGTNTACFNPSVPSIETVSARTHQRLSVPDTNTAADWTHELNESPGSATSVCTTGSTQMVAWWKGNGNPGDAVGPNHGTLNNGASYGFGKVGQGFGLAGDGDRVLVGTNSSLHLQNFTIEGWIKRSSASVTSNNPHPSFPGGTIFAFGSGGYGVLIDEATDRLMLTKVGTSNVIATAMPIVDTNFHHIAVTKSGDQVTFYVDGVASGPVTYPGNPAFTFGTSAAIGARGDGDVQNSFFGVVDELAIYSSVLNQSQIQAIVTAGNAGRCDTCVSAPAGMTLWHAANGDATDSVGNNDGTLANGATFGTGKVGQAYMLDGVNQHVTMPDGPVWDLGSGNFSIDAWIRPAGTAGAQRVISAGIESDGPMQMWALGYGDLGAWGGGVRLNFAYWQDPGYVDISSNPISLPLNTWHHVAVVRSGTNLTFYLNGTAVGGGSIGSVTLGGGTTGGMIGARRNVTNTIYEHANGSLDEIHLFNTALSSNDIQTLFNAGSAGSCPITTYSVTYDANGGVNPPTDPNSPYVAGATVTVAPVGSMTRAGFAFSHWDTAVDGSGDDFAPGAQFSIAADITLYAQWTAIAVDYSVTTTGGAIVVTDLMNSGDTVDISQPAAGQIRFAAAGKNFQIDGGSIVTGNSGDLVRAGANSITFNAEGGTDTVNLGGFTGTMPSLTVNGGAGDDTIRFNGAITFAAGANLDVDLTNDPSAGADLIDLATGNSDLVLSGTGAAALRTNRNINFATSSSITSASGDIDLSANWSTATTGDFIGIRLSSASVVSTSGDITVEGRGGTAGTGSQNGVTLVGNNPGGSSTIGGATTGTVTVRGRAGQMPNGSNNIGVTLASPNPNTATITSGGGAVLVEGFGGGAPGMTGDGNTGVAVGVNSHIGSSSTTASVTVRGTGGDTEGIGSQGINLASINSKIYSSGGPVLVEGTAQGDGFGWNNHGVELFGGDIIGGSGPAATVTVRGWGAGANDIFSGFNHGVSVGNDAEISGGGNVLVEGVGGNSNFVSSFGYNIGVNVGIGKITSNSSTGTVTVKGTGGTNDGANNYGVLVTTSPSSITSSGGDVLVEGIGGGDGTNGDNPGVLVVSQGKITSDAPGAKVTVKGTGGPGGFGTGVSVSGVGSQIISGGGPVEVEGTGGGSGSAGGNHGVSVSQGGKITSGNGASVSVLGRGGNVAGTGNNNYGILLSGPDTPEITSGGGNISVTGIAGGGAASYGIRTSNTGRIGVTSGTPTVTLIADSMDLLSAASVAAGANTVNLLTNTAGTTIGLGGVDVLTGAPPLLLGLTDAELDSITAGTLNIGSATSGDLNVSSSISRPISTNVKLASGGDVVISGGQFNTGGGTLVLDPGASPKAVKPTNSGVDVTASTLSFLSDLAIVINGTTVDSQYSQLDVAGAINLTGVSLLISGSYVPTGSEQFTIVDNDGGDPITGTFTGLAEGAVIPNFLGSGLNATISYVGGSGGNDVVINVAGAVVAETDVAIDGSGNVTVTDGNGGSTNDTITVSVSGGNLRIQDLNNSLSCPAGTQTNSNTCDIPLGSVASLTVNTLGGDDALTVDFAGGSPIPSGGVSYNGGTQATALGDRLTVTGGSSSTVTHTFTNANDGSVALSTGTIAYTGLEPVTDNMSALDRVFTFNGGAETITLSDAAGAGVTRIDSTLGELVDFTAPGNSTTINAGTGNDTVNIAGVDAALNRHLIINGNGGNDTVNFQNDITFAADFSLDVDLVNDSSAGEVDAVSFSANTNIVHTGVGGSNVGATQAVSFAAGSGITTVNGPITINANQQVAATTGTFNGITVTGAQLTTSGSGTVTLNGRGSAGPGIAISGGSLVRGGNTAAAVKTILNGTSGGAGSFGHGIQIGDNGVVTSLGGDISVVGTGSTTSGDVNHGIILYPGGNGGRISGTLGATVTVNGTGGAAGTGVLVDGDLSNINGVGGTAIVNVTGTGGSGATPGIHLSRAADITNTGTGAVTLNGTPGSGGNGIFIEAGDSGPSQITASSLGSISLIADSTRIDSTNTFVGAGTVNIRQRTNLYEINLGGADPGTSLGITDDEIDRINTTTLNIGNASSGTISFSGAVPINVVDAPVIPLLVVTSGMSITSNPAAGVLDIVADELTLRSAVATTADFDATTLRSEAVAPLSNSQTLSEANSVTVSNIFAGEFGSVTLTGGRFNTVNPTGSIVTNTFTAQGTATLGGDGAVGALTSSTIQSGATISPGTSPGILTMNRVGMAAGSTLAIEIGGVAQGTEHDQLFVTGDVNLGGATLSLTPLGAYTPIVGQTFTIVQKIPAGSIVGTFNGLPEGATIPNFLGSSLAATISYTGGDGNDVVLTVVSLPSLSINDVSLNEGNAGTTIFAFTVSLSAPAGASGVTFDIATADGTATTANNDYVGQSLTGQTISPGNSTYTFTVAVNGDTSSETNETFFVNVTNVTGATITDGQGQGTINNDDVACTPNPVVVNDLDTGAGSLRNAVAIACSGSTITFGNGAGGGGTNFTDLTADIIDLNGEILLDKDLTIQGTGANLLTVRNAAPAGPTSRVFRISSVASVTISGLTVADSNVLIDDSSPAGNSGGGIINNGSLTIDSCVVRNNSYSYVGGQIGINNGGGGITSGGRLRIARSLIEGNGSNRGFGGGLISSGDATIENSTVSGNSAVSSHPSYAGGGGGIAINGSLALINSTVAFNTAGGGGSGSGGIGGGVYSDGVLVVRNSIVSNNTAAGGLTYGPDIYGYVASLGHNLVSNTADINSSGSTFPSTGDIQNQDPQLQPLALNGGPTRTHQIPAASLAVNAAGDLSEIQTIRYFAFFSGNFTLTFNGQTTAPLTHNATAAQVQAALNGLSTIGGVGGSVTVASATGIFTGHAVQFGGTLSTGDQPQITIAGTVLSPSSATLLEGNQIPTTDQRGPGFAREVGSAIDMGAFEIQNSAPTISDVGDQSTNEDTPTGAIAFTVGDGETPAADLVVTATSSDTTLVPNANISLGGSGANRTVTITPAANLSGSTTITLTVTDAGGATAADTFLLTVNAVNDPPSISDVGDQSTNEDTPTGAIPFTVGDLETAAGSLVVTASSSNTTLVPNANIALGGSGASRTVTITPAANQSGSTTITLTVSDGVGSASDTFQLTVNPVNDPPTISDVGNQTTNEDTPTGAIAFSVGDIETAAGSLTVSGSSSNTTLVPNANIVFGGSGSSRTVTITPAANQNGSATITLTVSDGVANATDTFVLTVNAVDDPPVAVNDAATVAEDSGANAIDVLANDTDIDAGPKTVNSATQPANGTVVITGAGAGLTYQPNANYCNAPPGTAPDTFTYTLNGGSTATVTVTVTCVNDAPTISDVGNQATSEDTPTGAIAFSVGDIDTPVGSLTVTGSSSNTTLVPNANIVFGGSGASRTVTITPAANQFGAATITLTVSDGSLMASDTFVLTVNPAADTPSVTGATTVHGAITTSGLVISRNPADGAEVTHFKITNITNGTLYLNDGTTPIANGTFITFAQGNAGLRFRPNIGFIGNATFQIQASLAANDSGLGGNVITATIVVNPAATTTTVTSSVNPSTFGQDVTFTAAVTTDAPGTGVPTGTVTFRVGGTDCATGTVLGIGTLNASGQTSVTTSSLAAGGHTIRACYASNAPTHSSSSGSVSQSVNKAVLTVQASSHTVTYGAAAPVVTANYSGFVNGDDAGDLTTQPTCTTTYTQGSSVSGSPYVTSCSGGAAANYTFNYVNGTVTVNKAVLTVDADDKSRVYGAANPALTATITGFVLNQTLATSGVTGTPQLTTTAVQGSPVGTYPITAGLGSLQSSNYTFNFTGGTLTVTKATLNVAADNKTKVVGTPNPALTYSFTGFANGENLSNSGVTGTPSISTTATQSSPVGTYPIDIEQGTLASANYTFTFTDGTLTVTQGGTTIAITNASTLNTTPSLVGQPYTVSFTVSPVAPAAGSPTGLVTVSDGTGQTCTFTLQPANNGSGSCSLTPSTPGVRTLTAVYAGDGNFTGSTSTTVQHTVVIGVTGNIKQFVAFGTNTNLAGVTVTLSGDVNATTTTDAAGNYSFGLFANAGTLVITPSGLGKIYEPTSRTYTNVSTSITGADFIAYDVSGPNALPREISIVNTVASGGNPVTVPIDAAVLGNERRFDLSVNYSTSLLGIPTAACGDGVPGCTLTVNTSLPGRIGLSIVTAGPMTAGVREIATLTFPTFVNTASSTALTFGDEPTDRVVRNAAGDPLPANYRTGFVSFMADLEADVVDADGTAAAGDGVLSNDVTVIRQMVLGTMQPVAGQYRKADAAPRGTLGDGCPLNAGDVTQASRYNLGLDPPTAAGGPTAPNPALCNPPTRGEFASGAADRVIRAINAVTTAGGIVHLPIEIAAAGDESSASFTVNWNPAVFQFVGAVPADGVPTGTVLSLNTLQAAQGRLGVLLDSTETYAAGARRMMVITLQATPGAVLGTYPVTFSTAPTLQSVSSADGRLLETEFQGANIVHASDAPISISGRVTTPSGQGLRNAVVKLTTTDGTVRTATTSSFGNYIFENVGPGQQYTLSVVSRRYRFAPRTVDAGSGSITGVDMVGLE